MRATARVLPSRRMVSSCSATSMETVRCLWARPRAIFWPKTMTMPMFDARRWTRTGSVDGLGSWSRWSGRAQLADFSHAQRLGRTRSRSRVSGSKNIRVCWSTRTATRRPARISVGPNRPHRCRVGT